jgi:hypothetical protein
MGGALVLATLLVAAGASPALGARAAKPLPALPESVVEGALQAAAAQADALTPLVGVGAVEDPFLACVSAAPSLCAADCASRAATPLSATCLALEDGDVAVECFCEGAPSPVQLDITMEDGTRVVAMAENVAPSDVDGLISAMLDLAGWFTGGPWADQPSDCGHVALDTLFAPLLPPDGRVAAMEDALSKQRPAMDARAAPYAPTEQLPPWRERPAPERQPPPPAVLTLFGCLLFLGSLLLLMSFFFSGRRGQQQRVRQGGEDVSEPLLSTDERAHISLPVCGVPPLTRNLPGLDCNSDANSDSDTESIYRVPSLASSGMSDSDEDDDRPRASFANPLRFTLERNPLLIDKTNSTKAMDTMRLHMCTPSLVSVSACSTEDESETDTDESEADKELAFEINPLLWRRQ